MIEEAVSCMFATVVYWGLCREFTAYDRTCLSRKLYVRTENKYLCRLLASTYPRRKRVPEEDRNKLSVLGLATYVALLPVLLAVYAAVFRISAANMPAAWWIYAAAVLLLNPADFWFGYLPLWWARRKENRKRRNPGMPKEVLWSGAEPEEMQRGAEAVFLAPDKIIWDMDQQEYYYLRGKELLRLRRDGTFLSLTPDAGSPRVLKAMRTGRIIKS